MAPSVSVVMPAYRAESTIGAAISSVLTQTVDDLEVVVVDDGSDDATADIVASHRDPRVRLVQQANGGVSTARNAGIAAARSELIAFCDADDVLFPSHVASLLERIRSRTLVTANAYWLLPGGISEKWVRHKGPFPAPQRQRMAILEQNFVSIMTLFPTALFEEIGPFDESLGRAEDWDFWMRAVYAGFTVLHQPRPLAMIRASGSSLSAAADRMDEDVRRVIERVAERNDLRPEERAYVQQRLAGPEPRVLFRDAERALREGRHREAADLYRRAAVLLPHERRLVWMANLMGVAPLLVGPVVRRRRSSIESALGFGDEHVR